MDLTPTIQQLKEQIKQLEKIVTDLEYQQLLNRALNNAHKTKTNEHHSNEKGEIPNTGR